MHISLTVLAFFTLCVGIGLFSQKAHERYTGIPYVVFLMIFGLGFNALATTLSGSTFGHLVPDFMELVRSDHPSELVALGFTVSTMIILFGVGLEGSFAKLRESAKVGVWVALTGIFVPMLLVGATVYTFFPEAGAIGALAAGGVSTATSVAISAAVLNAKGIRTTTVGSIVIAAAVIDDILGLGILQGVVALGDLRGAEGVSWWIPFISTAHASDVAHASSGSSSWLTGLSTVGLFVGLIYVSHRWGEHFFYVMRAWTETSRELMLVFWLLLFGSVALAAGIEPILGAYAAGLVFDESFVVQPGEEADAHDKPVEHLFRQLEAMLSPFFFVPAMCMIDPVVLMDLKVLGVGLVFSVLFVVGKLAAGLLAPEQKLVVGTSMVARGEVGIIFASICLSKALLTPDLFGMLMVAILVSTVLGALMLGPVIDRGRASADSLVPAK